MKLLQVNGAIAKTVVSVPDMLDFFPRHVGMRFLMVAENLVYSSMQKLCTEYNGGQWDFFDLSNGAFYLAPRMEPTSPDGKVKISSSCSYNEAWLTPDAAGIVATLMALTIIFVKNEHLSDTDAWENIVMKHRLLTDYVRQHPEAASILAAID